PGPAFPIAAPAPAESAPAALSPAPPAPAHNASATKKEQPSCFVPLTRPPPQTYVSAIIMEAGVFFVSPKLLFLPVCIALLIGLTGCRQNASSPAQSASQQKTFTIRGKVVATSGNHITLDGEDVPGFMEAMTMDYKLKDPNVANDLHPGDRITATVLPDTHRAP